MLKPWFRVRACVRMATLLCVVFVVLFPSQQTTAAVGINRQLNYQAKLLTSNAVPVSDGTYTIIFSLYDAAAGGNRLWTAGGTTSSPSAVNVTLTSGLMTVQLGDTSAGQNPLNIDWHQDSLYLGVSVNGDSEMSPRKRLTAVPYAFMAESLQGQFASSSVPATGGTLFKLQQSSSDAASSPRTALFVSTSGTSDVNDFLIKAFGDSEVFTVSRQGHTTTTGNFATNGNAILGDASTDSVVVNAQVNSSLIPAANNTFSIGSSSNSWANIYASGTLRIGAGSVSSPAINFARSNNSGWYSAGAGSVSLSLNGVGPYMTIAPNTNGVQLGIGITFAANNSYSIGSGSASIANLFASGTAYIGTDVKVNGSSVCLSSGLNCPTAASSTDLNWAFNGATDLMTAATATTDIVIGGSATTTAPVFFSLFGENASTSRLIIGQNQNMDVVIGGTTSTASNTAFQFSGNDLFVQGNIGSATSVYSNGAFIAGGGTMFGDGFITKTSAGNISVSTTGNLILLPGTNDFVGIGTSTPNVKLTIARGAENLIHMKNTLSATGDWYEAIGSGTQFTDGRFIISQGVPTASNYELQFEGGGIVSARTAMAAPSFNSALTGVGTVNVMKWTNSGGNFNGYLSVGPTHQNPGTGGADTRLYMGSSVSSTVSIRDWFDVVYLTVLHGGNVGIGTTVPSTTLEVVGTVSSTVISSGRLLPHSNNLYDIGSATRSWANIYASGTLFVGGVTSSGSISPFTNNVYDVGTGSASWRNIFASGTAYIGANGFINGNLSIGTSTATERLTVAGSIANLLDTSSTLVTRSSVTVTSAASAAFEYMDVKGNYVYGIDDNDGTGNMVIVDVTDPASASTTAYHSLLPAGGSGQGIVASGQYVYTLTTDAATADHYLKVTDVSNHSFPVDISTTTMADSGTVLAVQGQRAYITGSSFLSVYDISNPRRPVILGMMNIGGLAFNITVSGRYAYIAYGAADVGADFLIADISTSTPSIISRTVAQGTTLGPGTANGVAVADGYAYVTNAGSSTLSIIDVTDPVHPRNRANFPFSRSTTPKLPNIQGRYAYIFAQGSSTIDVIDIASSTNPTRVKAFSTFAGTNSFRVQGKYIYFFTNNKLVVYEIPGLETAAVNAHSGEFGTLQVRGQSVLGGDLFVGNSLSVGQGGIITNGGITSLSTNTSTFQGAIAFWSSTGTDPGNAAYITPRAFFTDTELTIHATSTCLSGCNETSGRLRLETGGVASIMIDPGLGANAQIRLGGGSDTDQVIFNARGASDFAPNLDNTYLLGDISPVLRWRAFLSDATATRIEIDGPSSASTSLYAAAIARPVLPSASVNGLSVMIVTSTNAMGTSTAADIPLNTTIPMSTGGLPYQAAGFFVNKVGATASSDGGFGVLAFDMTSSSAGSPATAVKGGALVAARKCGTATNTDIAVFGTDADNRKVSIRCSGQIFADNNTVGSGGDYAELFPTADAAVTTGDVVTMNADTTSSVRRSISEDREYVLGVVSDNSALIGNAGKDQKNYDDPHYRVVGLIGQLPVKSSNVNGQIVAGDKVMAGDDGYAVKATGVGMILGQAMESLSNTTGTVMVYVDPIWSADGVLESIDGGTLVRPVAIATSTGMVYDSFGFTFRGSAWSGQSATTVSSNFTLVNDVITASSSVFTVRGSSNQGLLTISELGNVGISGDLTVGKRLFLGSKMTGAGSSSAYIYVDDSLAPTSTYIATNADGWATSSTYDYAERFHSADTLMPGDLVVADQLGTDRVKRAATRNDVILGIVSTRPGFVTGAHSTGTFPIALAGRVPTRVSTKNGPIVAGDQLAPSDDAGVAVKAIGSGPVVGIALEGYDAPVEGKISVFVQPGWKGGEIVSSGTSQSTVTYQTPPPIGVSSRTGLAMIAAGAKQVNVSFQSLNAYPLVTVAPYGQTTGGWWLTNVNDHGFTIVLGEAPMFDLVFAWKAEPSQSGNVEWYSDGTFAPYDVTSGRTSGVLVPVDSTSSTDAGITATTSELVVPSPVMEVDTTSTVDILAP